MTLYLIAGHGAGDPGATGNGYTEAERVRALCARIKELGGSNVVYLDPNKNWYRDNGISTLNVAKGDCLLECHMDWGASESVQGGHVIIYKGFDPDIYDNTLAEMLEEILPGRSQMIVPRGDLANPRRAANKGINYRLVEFGFITSEHDVDIFNSQMDTIAKRVLSAFGIAEVASPSVTTAPTPQETPEGRFVVRVLIDDLNLRSEPKMGDQYIKGVIEKGAYTIVDTEDGFGKLLSGAGWIYIENPAYVTILGGVVATPTTPKKSVEEIAKEVIKGLWGNGAARKAKLEEAGYDYEAVRLKVNEMF